MDLTRLVVSEPVTNARKYGPGPVLMKLRVAGDLVEVVVRDSDPVLPVARVADAGRAGQHGLEMVMAVAQGFEVQREPVGKRITARIALLEGPGGTSPDAAVSSSRRAPCSLDPAVFPDGRREAPGYYEEATSAGEWSGRARCQRARCRHRPARCGRRRHPLPPSARAPPA